MIGHTVSHYRVTGRLGKGGMGDVYEAEDVRLGRRVALKVLPAGARTDPEARARLEREARAASLLDHPNVGIVHEIGEGPDGSLFIAMARYDGPTLRERLDAGPLAVDEAVDLARQIGEGLRCAHEAGVVHRDVKPSNVVVTPEGVVEAAATGPCVTTTLTNAAEGPQPLSLKRLASWFRYPYVFDSHPKQRNAMSLFHMITVLITGFNATDSAGTPQMKVRA